MDYLKEANLYIEEAKDIWARSDRPDAGVTQATLAVAAALITLVERLDRVTSDNIATDGTRIATLRITGDITTRRIG